MLYYEKKRVIILFITMIFTIVCLSSVAFAYGSQSTIYYEYRLPATGYRDTISIEKYTNETYATNDVDYTGSNDRIDFWVCDSNNDRESTQSYFYGPGLKYAYYASQSQADELEGTHLHMRIKTGPYTFNEVDVKGHFAP